MKAAQILCPEKQRLKNVFFFFFFLNTMAERANV
jgi:hypothetical protein